MKIAKSQIGGKKAKVKQLQKMQNESKKAEFR